MVPGFTLVTQAEASQEDREPPQNADGNMAPAAVPSPDSGSANSLGNLELVRLRDTLERKEGPSSIASRCKADDKARRQNLFGEATTFPCMVPVCLINVLGEQSKSGKCSLSLFMVRC